MTTIFFQKKTLTTDLYSVVNSYMSEKDVQIIKKAYKLSENAHRGQYRKSGEKYINHPLAVSIILADLRLDYCCIVAAILHDCIEDTYITKDDISKEFGAQIAHIVEGVTNLTNLKFNSKHHKQSKNLQKLFFAMSKDMRVIIIKLADRLHNMRTISSMNKEKQMEKAVETEEIYAPIADRLGLNSIKTELEDICFQILHPRKYTVLKNKIKKQYGNQNKTISLIQTQIKEILTAYNIKADIKGRQKSLYSIYNKMKSKSLKFSEIIDLHAFRVIVKDDKECYQSLGALHSLYKPLPAKFKDYIAIPKTNGYQSIHTVLIGPRKIFIEVQIKSKAMHFASEYGIAAHWHYKSKEKDFEKLAQNWLGPLLDLQKNTDSSIDFLARAKENLFSNEVLVFTPSGEIIQLPAKSTVLDFAYAVHTNVGKKTKKANINGNEVSLSTKLKTGQTIEIITNRFVKPNNSWLNMVVTSKAQVAIKAQLKEKSKTELMKMGKNLILDALKLQKIDIDTISKKKWQNCLDSLSCADIKELYIKVGLYEILASVVVNILFNRNEDKTNNIVKIRKTKGMPINFAHCCYPIPGDKVIGITTNKGIVMHRKKCSNLIALKNKRTQWLDILLNPEESEFFQVPIKIVAKNQSGVLANVANVLAKMEINIEYINQKNTNSVNKLIDLIADVSNVSQLNKIIQNISELKNVISVNRD